jgi:hypothetical protein
MGAWLPYWLGVLFVLAANTIIATLAWVLVGLVLNYLGV